MISLSSRNVGQFAVRCIVYSATLQVANSVMKRIMANRLEKRENKKSGIPQ